MRLRLFWRTKPAADEVVDITESTRKAALRDGHNLIYDPAPDADAKILRVSGKPRPKGKTIPALVVRSDRCNS